ncbi:DUF4349 domain-containing protein [Flavobacterium quisquiliarum]|uniref:DUF4349 domain-containing protein n=1 Tax=Flavobacterium quisquiliarum TaxID=1834436 RepID=A0ABV8WCF2_9FLAO|nr:DUF4349 domain-containing protein [Flavobacterium quisquiliarum]MBW1658008.1 DUF4349 domain-containing protein [Flavobacterium quisquiliarum]NWL01879.1 DUF4349 domain-containing protein [Flavobacterium collinsii]
MRRLFFLLVLVLILLGCSKSSASAEENYAIATVQLPPKSSSDSYEKSADPKAPPVPKEKEQIEQKIIKEATLKFETDNLENSFSQIQKAVSNSKARIINDSEGKDFATLFRNLTIKVPSQNFDRFINDVSKGVSYFEVKNISAQDVTEQFIDLTSRLKTKKKLEERYLEILKKANKVSEILEIEEQISTIREEIEAKEGQLKYLESRVSESTITIEFYKTIAEKEGVKISYGSKIWNAVKSGFYTLSDLLLSLLSAWPFVILIVVFAYFIRRRLKRRKKE